MLTLHSLHSDLYYLKGSVFLALSRVSHKLCICDYFELKVEEEEEEWAPCAWALCKVPQGMGAYGEGG